MRKKGGGYRGTAPKVQPKPPKAPSPTQKSTNGRPQQRQGG
jgi:hypothetical protein